MPSNSKDDDRTAASCGECGPPLFIGAVRDIAAYAQRHGLEEADMLLAELLAVLCGPDPGQHREPS
jgi:hypothetical protein